MVRNIFSLLITATLVFEAVFSNSWAEDSDPARDLPEFAPAAIADDPAFERFVDLGLAIRAVRENDASLLCDVALQLADAERCLMRKHKSGLTAKELLDRCLNAAIHKADAETIQRIAKASQQPGNEELAAKIHAAEQLGGEARGPQPLSIPLDELTADDYASLKDLITSIETARLVGNPKALDEAERSLTNVTFLTDKQKSLIRDRIQAARVAVEEEGEPSDAFAKLMTPARVGGYVGQRLQTFEKASRTELGRLRSDRADRARDQFDRDNPQYSNPNSWTKLYVVNNRNGASKKYRIDGRLEQVPSNHYKTHWGSIYDPSRIEFHDGRQVVSYRLKYGYTYDFKRTGAFWSLTRRSK